MAFTDEGELAWPPASRRAGAQKRKRARAKHAMTLNVASALEGIALRWGGRRQGRAAPDAPHAARHARHAAADAPRGGEGWPRADPAEVQPAGAVGVTEPASADRATAAGAHDADRPGWRGIRRCAAS